MSDVGDGKHLRSHQQVLSLISFFLGRPVCPPFYQPGVVLEVASHRAVEGILVSPAQHKPYFFLFFFQNNRASAASYSQHSSFPSWMPRQVPELGMWKI